MKKNKQERKKFKKKQIAWARDRPKKKTGISNFLEQWLHKLGKKLSKVGGTKFLLQNFPYLLCGYFGNKLAYQYHVTESIDGWNRVMNTLAGMEQAFISPFPSLYAMDLLFGIFCGIALKLIVYWKGKHAKKYRHGIEYGSARWGKETDIKPYMDEVFENNVILTETEGLMMSGRPKEPKYARNKNILVIGGSGSGKTRFFVKPNLMQMHSSYVVTDPKGTVLIECGKMLVKNDYKIKVFNTINFKKSMHYNPIAYLRSEKDILKLVNTIIVNTKGEGQQASEDFWVKAERLLYQAYLGFIYYECVEEERNLITLIEMINASETREEDENFKNRIDLMFEELEASKPNHFAVNQYKKYKLAAGVINCKRLLNQNKYKTATA